MAKGHVVVDETPIGNFGEIEGPSRWIDRTAKCFANLSPATTSHATYTDCFSMEKADRKSCERNDIQGHP